MTNRGRPKLPKGESKAVMLSLRLQPEEMKRLEAEAEKIKQPVSELVRSKLFSQPPLLPEQPSLLVHNGNRVEVKNGTPENWRFIERYAKAMGEGKLD